LSTFHTRVDQRSVPHFPIENNGAKMPKNARHHARNSPFPLRHVDFHLTHERQNASSIAVHTSTQRRNKGPIGYNWTPQIHSQTALPLRRSQPKSNTTIPSPTPLTTQMASRSNQPCCHCSHVRTDRWDGRMFSNISALLAILIDSDAGQACHAG